MKRKLVKGVLMLSLAGTLAFSTTALPGTGPAVVQAAKVIGVKTNLGQVSGIAYDSKTKRISWNKVPGATSYHLEIKNAAGTWSTTSTVSSLSYSFDPDDYSYYNSTTESWETLTNGTYGVTITAKNDDEMYLVKSGVTRAWDSTTYEYSYGGFKQGVDFDYRETEPKASDSAPTTYSLYKYPEGQPVTASLAVAIPDTSSSSTTITALPGIKIKEKGDTSVIFQPTAEIALRSGEQVYWEYSNNASFLNNTAKNYYKSTRYVGYWDNDQSLEVYYSSFAPGDTIYVRARIYNSNYNYKTSYEEKYGPYSAVLKVTVPQAKMSWIDVTSTTSQVVLTANTSRGYVTGYQFAKKVGSKWNVLATQTDDTYTDQGLTKETTYQYRVRAYTYNETTKKTVWTDWLETKAMTWGSNLNLRAGAASATSAKLTWKAVSGAEGYEIYRYDAGSSSINYDKGIGLEGNSKAFLVKTAGKKTKSYTDKGLSKNRSYYYTVRAYKTVGKQKIYITDGISVNLQPGSLSGLDSYVTAAGKKVVTWSKAAGLKGYYVEKYDEVKGEYATVKTLKASATSYTFDKVNPGSDRIRYRIRPFDANAVYDGSTIYVYPTIAAPAKVKAVKTANGVKVTWSAVAGADYYNVYRTMSSSYTYNKTTKLYSYPNGETVYEGAVNTTGCEPQKGDSPYRSAGTYATSDIRTTSVEDKALAYVRTATDENGDYIKAGTAADGSTLYATEQAFYDDVQGPEAGNTYYYYVVACVRDANGAISTGSMNSGCTKAAKVTYTNKAAGKGTTISSVKSKKKGQVVVTIKKAKGVKGYAVYRSTKKNGTYTMIGTTTKASFTDTGAPSGKTAYYKVATYVEGEMKSDVYSAKSAAKSVKVK